MATLIYNSNENIKWEKTACNNYTITNLSVYSPQDVTITDLTGTYTESFSLDPSASNSIILPGDGVYKICSTQLLSVPSDTYTVDSVQYTTSVVNLGPMLQGIDPLGSDITRVLSVTTNIAGLVYESPTIGGTDPENTFQTNITPLVTVLQSVPNVIDAIVLAPNDSSLAPIFPADPVNYQLIYITSNGDSITNVNVQVLGLGPDVLTPEVSCIQYFDTYNTGEGTWIYELYVLTTNILDRPYNLSDAVDQQAFLDYVQSWLDDNGGGFIANGPRDNYQIYGACFDLGNISFATLIPGEQVCDYIYEFCALYACITTLMRRWLCMDPCTPTAACDDKSLSYEDARRRAIEMSTLFFHALMPVVAQDRIWYFGNWDVTDSRTTNINTIVDLFQKLKDYTSKCGFGCYCDDCVSSNCYDCTPCSGNSYTQVNTTNSSTTNSPCGCNK